MGAEEYDVLVAPPEHEDALVAYCAGCHGLDGAGRDNSVVPRLDLLSETYIAASLRAYRDGARNSGVMQHAASQLDDGAVELLARRFGAKPPAPVAPPPMADDLVALGRTLAFGTPDSRDVPACRACHGPWPSERSELFPALAGQRPGYLYTQLMLWNSQRRGGTPRAHIMHLVGQELGDEHMRALAAFYAAGAPVE
jgi:cytochrome c oxidase subunit 1